MKQLPTGIQNFETIRTQNGVYVDKTAHIYNLIKGIKNQFFLSRPRRFGKTLLCSTLTALFQGRKELFEGLAISKTDWKWESHPVIRMDMSQGDFSKGLSALEDSINTQLMISAKSLNLELAGETLSTKFKNLILAAYLIKLLDEQKIDILNIEKSSVSYSDFKRYDSENMDAVPILYQSGYLTIVDYDREFEEFILDYPNTEVRTAFANELSDLTSLYSQDAEDLLLAVFLQHAGQKADTFQQLK